jgi:hypothetical protein
VPVLGTRGPQLVQAAFGRYIAVTLEVLDTSAGRHQIAHGRNFKVKY